MQIAITEDSAAELTSIVREFAWGAAEESLSFVGGSVFGRIVPSRWSAAGPRLAAASADLTVISLWPMLELPIDIAPPSPMEFAHTLCRVLTASDIWILGSEFDFDQRTPLELELDATDVSQRVVQLLEESQRLDLIAYSSSAAPRFSPRPRDIQ